MRSPDCKLVSSNWRRLLGLMFLVVGNVVAGLVSTSALAEDQSTDGLAPLIAILPQLGEAEVQLDALRGIREGLKGRRQVSMPDGWKEVYGILANSPNAELRREALLLALQFGDQMALSQTLATVANSKASRQDRIAALDALAGRRPPQLLPVLYKLLDPDQPAKNAMRGHAIRALGEYADAAIATRLLKIYPQLAASEQQDAVQTLCSRSQWAIALLNAVGKGTVPSSDISAASARQLKALGNKEVRQLLAQHWGTIRRSSADRRRLIASYKSRLTDEVLAAGNATQGRAIFQKTCQQCHRLYGEGAKIGPDLTGSNRANLDYFLENTLDPSASIGKDYRLNVVVTDDGRVITGLAIARTSAAITLQTVNQQITIPRNEIDELTVSPVSMMPEGQLEKMSLAEIRDLVVYLRTQEQVELPNPPAGK